MSMTMSEQNKNKWTKIIEDQKQSGLSIVQYCKDHDLNEKTFYRYRTLLGLSPTQILKPVTIESKSDSMIRFYFDDIPVRMNTKDLLRLIHGWNHKS